MKIKLGAQNDTLTIPTSSFGDDVSIDLGGGDNALAFCDGAVGGNVALKVSAGTGGRADGDVQHDHRECQRIVGTPNGLFKLT